MGAMQIIKKSVVKGCNVFAWMGTDQIRKNTKLIKELATAALVPQKKQAHAPKVETFEQAIKRLGLTEAGLQKRIKASTQIIFMCGLLSIPMLAYTIYIFMSDFYLPGFVCLMLTFLLFAYSFREHFNRFQMQQRRLGCTLAEWFAHTVKLKSSPRK
jgi:intracellular multiplication protein IcmV